MRWLAALGCTLLTAAAHAQAVPRLVVQTGHRDTVRFVAWSPDGALFASAGRDAGEVKLWDPRLRREFGALRTGDVTSLSFGAENASLLVGGNPARLFHVETGAELRAFDGVGPAAYTRDGSKIATSGADRSVRLYDASSGALLRALPPFASRVTALAFDPAGTLVLAGDLDGLLRASNVVTGAVVWEAPELHSGTQIAFSPDGKLVVSGHWHERLEMREADTGKLIRKFDGHAAQVNGIAFHPGGTRFGTASHDGTVKLWDVAGSAFVKSTATLDDRQHGVAFSPDGKLLVTTNGSGSVQVRDPNTLAEIYSLAGQAFPVQALAFGVDGRTVLTSERSWVSQKRTIREWGGKTGLLPRTIVRVSEPLERLVFAADGLRAASLNRTEITFLEVATGKELARATVAGSGADGIMGGAFSADGSRFVATSNDRKLRVWLATTGLLERTVALASGGTLPAFTRDGARVVVGSFDAMARLSNLDDGARVQVIGVATGRELASLAGFTSGVPSPDGTTLAITAESGQIRMIQLTTRAVLATLEGCRGGLHGPLLAFSAKGDVLHAGCRDGRVLRFALPAGTPLAPLIGHAGTVNAIAARADGWLATGADDGRTLLWDATGTQRVALIGIGEAESIAATTEGAYQASRGATRGVGFRIGRQLFPFEQFDLRLNRPDLVLERSGLGAPGLVELYRRASERRQKRLGAHAGGGDLTHLPVFELLTKDVPASTRERALTLRVRATSTTAAIERLHVHVNDVPVHGAAGLALGDRATKSVEHELAFQLGRGRNKIQLWATDAAGLESLRQTVEVSLTGVVGKPDLFVIAVGISQYVDSQYNLTYAAKDARDVVAALESQKDAYGVVRTIALLDGDATREKILAAKATLAQSKVDDEVVVFVAGHGLLDENLDYILATTDIDFTTPRARGLAYDELEGLLDGIPARRKLLLMDTCHAGEVDRDEVRLASDGVASSDGVRVRAVGSRGVKKVARQVGLEDLSLLLTDLFSDLRRGSGSMVIASSGGAEYALESAEWKNGVFTYAVLTGIKGRAADGDKSGEISVSELRDHVVATVQRLTGGRQTPTVRRENLEFDFPVFLYGAPKVRGFRFSVP